MTHSSKIAAVSLACFLAACGGGGDSTASEDTTGASTPAASSIAEPVDKYLGRWKENNCDLLMPPGLNPTYPNGLSEITEVRIAKVSANEYGTTSIETQYHDVGCSGTVVAQTTTLGVAQIHGTKTIGFGAVDKVIREKSGVSTKMVTQVVDGNLYTTGDTAPGITLDAEGYPQSMNTAAYLIKMPS